MTYDILNKQDFIDTDLAVSDKVFKNIFFPKAKLMFLMPQIMLKQLA
jgi:hypothetical protein